MCHFVLSTVVFENHSAQNPPWRRGLLAAHGLCIIGQGKSIGP